MAERDRLNSTQKRKAIHNILIVVGGFIVIIILAAVFGEKLLVGYSLLMEQNQGNNDANQDQQSITYVAPPTINTLPTATNKPQITVSGIAQKNADVKLYVNNQLVDKTSVDSNNKFTFSNVALKPGQNTIQTKAAIGAKESVFSEASTVSYLKDPPALSLNQPQDGQGFSKSSSPTISVEGQTDAGAKVTVNGFWAIVDDSGKYTYLYTLKDGDNDIKVVATDAAGNQTTKEIHIHTQ